MPNNNNEENAEEVRVLEVQRRVRVVQEDVKSEKLVYHLKDGQWLFHTAGAYDFDIPTLETALGQLKKLSAPVKD